MPTNIKVISVNCSTAESITVAGRSFVTGINKQPKRGGVAVGTLGLEGDAVIDSRFHGGPDQAVYLYRQEDYDWWIAEGLDVCAGKYGENLTVTGLPGPGLMVGDILLFPDLELQVTAPRIPCSTLATIMGDPGFAKVFMQAARPGIYFRVLRPGSVSIGDEIELIPTTSKSISTIDFFHEFHSKLSDDRIRAYLELPIDIRSRTDLEARLSKGNRH
jgi:MOSC domain-containing protein YiiM